MTSLPLVSQYTRTEMRLAMVPDGTNNAASLPMILAISVSKRWAVGSAPRTSSSTSAIGAEVELVEAEVGAGGHVAEHAGADTDELLHEDLERELGIRGDVGRPSGEKEADDAAAAAVTPGVAVSPDPPPPP